MTPRSIFIIILKVLGIFLLKDIIETIPQLLSAIPFFTSMENFSDVLLVFITASAAIAVYILMMYYLIFRTNMIIDKLHLDRGFSQDSLTFNVSTTTIFTIAIIITGAFILITEIPDFCKFAISYFQEKRITHGLSTPRISNTVYSAVKIVLGLLLIGERKRIVMFIEQSRKKKAKGQR